MAAPLTSTLVADGRSDRVLLPLLERLLDEHCPGPYRSPHFAGLPAGLPLTERIRQALDLYPCDLLFVHRDAERQSPASRIEEIQLALTGLAGRPASVSIIPVRMTEAWLLVDEAAIRAAAGNPTGKLALDLPSLKKIELLPDPKEVLFTALRTASERPPGRLRKFDPQERRHRITELIDDLDRLRRLPSFAHLEEQIRSHFSH